MKYTLGQQERLKSRKLIGRLYSEGMAIKTFPLRMVYLQTEHSGDYPAQFGVSVPKRLFKRAVDRNRLKRLIREAYRLNKHTIYSTIDKPYVFMISYLGKTELSYQEIEDKLIKLLRQFVEHINIKPNEEQNI